MGRENFLKKVSPPPQTSPTLSKTFDVIESLSTAFPAVIHLHPYNAPPFHEMKKPERIHKSIPAFLKQKRTPAAQPPHQSKIFGG